MKIPQERFLATWLPIEVTSCPSFFRKKLGNKEVERRLTNTILQNWAYYSDPKKSKAAFDYCGVEGAVVEDYCYRCLTCELGEMVTSIRFIGGDLSKPAVFIMHKDFDLSSPEEIRKVGRFLKEAYQLFQPKRIRWYSAMEEKELLEKNSFIEGDLCYFAELVSYLQTLPEPQNYDAVTLVPATSIDWYDQYVASFEELYAARPFFREMARAESREVLEEMRAANLLWEINIGGEWAGIIGVCREEHWLLSGFVVYEEFLMAPFRGKRFAPAIQRQMIDLLDGEGLDMLYGTIHYLNLPSARTAMRVGRKAVGGYLFANVD